MFESMGLAIEAVAIDLRLVVLVPELIRLVMEQVLELFLRDIPGSPRPFGSPSPVWVCFL